jgi:hypothetical protein
MRSLRFLQREAVDGQDELILTRSQNAELTEQLNKRRSSKLSGQQACLAHISKLCVAALRLWTSRRVSQTGLPQALKRGKFSVEQVEEFGTKYFVVPRNSLTSTLPPKVAEFLMTPEELVAKHNMDTCELSLDAVFVF